MKTFFDNQEYIFEIIQKIEKKRDKHDKEDAFNYLFKEFESAFSGNEGLESLVEVPNTIYPPFLRVNIPEKIGVFKINDSGKININLKVYNILNKSNGIGDKITKINKDFIMNNIYYNSIYFYNEYLFLDTIFRMPPMEYYIFPISEIIKNPPLRKEIVNNFKVGLEIYFPIKRENGKISHFYYDLYVRKLIDKQLLAIKSSKYNMVLFLLYSFNGSHKRVIKYIKKYMLDNDDKNIPVTILVAEIGEGKYNINSTEYKNTARNLYGLSKFLINNLVAPTNVKFVGHENQISSKL